MRITLIPVLNLDYESTLKEILSITRLLSLFKNFSVLNMAGR